MTSLTNTQVEEEKQQKPVLSRLGLLWLALLMLSIGTIWRIVDIFVLNLGETPMNILPSKLGPLLVILLVFWKFRPTEIKSILGLSQEDYRVQITVGILMGFTVIFSMVFLAPILYNIFVDPTYPLTINIIHADLLWYMLFFFFVNAVFEEILFRGLLQNALNTKLDFKYALFIQAAIFGIWHATWPLINGPTSSTFIQEAISVVVLSGILGAFFGLYYEKFSHRRTLIGTITAHTIFNFMNECFKVGPSPTVQGPDFSFTEPGLMVISLLLFAITFGSMIVLALKYQIEDVSNLRRKVDSLLRRN
ncbi:MAG: CPBP family intramembrane metalloprotease [Candidatus Lokiarchaeota archaeon]|nr:CPBP family intramembrane metalloprotease [Candidatus Lokiarchaeota archaeon]